MMRQMGRPLSGGCRWVTTSVLVVVGWRKAQTGQEIIGVGARKFQKGVLQLVALGIVFQRFNRGRIPIVGRDAALLLEGGLQTQGTHATKGVGNPLAGLKFLVNEAPPFFGQATAPINFAHVKFQMDARFAKGHHGAAVLWVVFIVGGGRFGVCRSTTIVVGVATCIVRPLSFRHNFVRIRPVRSRHLTDLVNDGAQVGQGFQKDLTNHVSVGFVRRSQVQMTHVTNGFKRRRCWVDGFG
mmetsp:Transcript_5011/g.12464  ORF Transcript_5011/g.12464 Transcript_5011/m.12464 type:complete len:240 (+) Transcript_5011:467-1186(+)